MSYFEQDYMMRQLQLFIRAILKMFFQLDPETQGVTEKLSLNTDEPLNEIFQLLAEGKINEAESLLFEKADPANREHLKVGLLFYEELNLKTDTYLASCRFSRDEIKSGVRDLLEIYGLRSFTESIT